METNTLIAEVYALYNSTAAARNASNEAEARNQLIKLRDLLNVELRVPVPAEPEEAPAAEPESL